MPDRGYDGQVHDRGIAAFFLSRLVCVCLHPSILAVRQLCAVIDSPMHRRPCCARYSIFVSIVRFLCVNLWPGFSWMQMEPT